MKNKIIGRRLKELREEAKYSMQEVANYFDGDIKMIGRWEEGEGQPNAEQLLVLSSLYGISIDEILAGIKPVELVTKEFQEEYRREVKLNRAGKAGYSF